MSKISKAMAQAAAGAGGALPAEFSSEYSSTQGLQMHYAYCVEIPNSNLIAVLAVHQSTDLYLHIVEVNGSSLTATLRDTQHLGTKYTDDYGAGIMWNPYNSKLVCMKLDTSGNYIGYQIDINTSNGAITTPQTASLGNWSSGFRKPFLYNNTIRHIHNEYSMQQAISSSGERLVRFFQNYGNNNWNTFGWAGVGVAGDDNTQHNIVKNETASGLGTPIYDMGVYNNDTYILGRYASGTGATSFDNSDMANQQPLLTGSDMGVASGWDSIRDKLHIYTTNGTGNSYVQYRTYDYSSSNTSGISSNPSTSGTDSTVQVSGGMSLSNFVDGASGNVIAFNDRDWSSSSMLMYQFVYNDTGHSEVANILSLGSRRHVRGNPGAYNTAQDCNLVVYKANTNNHTWYFRAMRGQI